MGNGVITAPEAGGEIIRSPEDAALVGQAFGTPTVDPAGRSAAFQQAAQRSAFDTTGDKALTFVEGMVDALSLGFIRETGDEADLRRDVNAGSALTGNLAGVLLGLGVGGPMKLVTEAGEAAGRIAAKTLLKQHEAGIIARGLTEAGAGAAVTGATAFGHAVMDTLIEDREFAAETILDDMKLGGILGGVGGAAMGAFGKVAASRAEVQAMKGLVGDAAPVVKAIDDAMSAYDDALSTYQKQLGGLKQLREQGRLGRLSDEWMDVRTAAVQDAERAAKALKALDRDAALAGADEGAYKAYRKAAGRYREAVRHVDEVMTPTGPEWGDTVDLNTDTRIELNPLGKQMGDLDVMAGRQRVFDDQALAKLEAAEMSDGSIPTPSPSAGNKTANLRRPTPEPALPQNSDAAPGSLDDLNRLIAETPVSPYASGEAFFEGVQRINHPKAMDAVDPFQGQKLLEDWLAMKPHRVRPWDQAETRARAAMEDLYKASNGRFDSARGLNLVEKAGLAPADDMVGSYLDQAWSLKRVSHFAAQEARGVGTPLREAAMDAVVGALGAKLMGSGARGMGMAVAGKFLGYSGRLASASGRMFRKASESVAKFLTSRKVRSIAVATGNHPWEYGEGEVIQDPVERIQKIQFLASNPEGIRTAVANSMGDLGIADPDLLRAVQDRAVNQVTQIAVRAPAIYFDKLGRPLRPPAGKMREFHEFENAMHDVGLILDGLQNGSLTKPQIDALKTGWTSVHMKVTAEMLANPETLQKLSREQLRIVEQVTGLSLTGATDPMFLARQAQAWMPPAPPQDTAKPQAFNINPDGAPTPAQSNATGRAPGN